MILYPLVLKVGERNMGRVKGVEKMGKRRGVERIEGVRELKEAIAEIR